MSCDHKYENRIYRENNMEFPIVVCTKCCEWGDKA